LLAPLGKQSNTQNQTQTNPIKSWVIPRENLIPGEIFNILDLEKIMDVTQIQNTNRLQI
jgi:hypothetical protein